MKGSSQQAKGLGMTSQRTRERLVATLMDEGIRDHRVLEAVRSVPRHLFVDEALASRAYENSALPIGKAQTISQPWVVAKMTEALLEHDPMERVLEIGTGSGYQAAVLSRVVKTVYSIERFQTLHDSSRRKLRQMGYLNIRCQHGDGYLGWPERAPFDGILLTAAPEAIPDTLFSQLREGGVLVAPVGDQAGQKLRKYIRQGDKILQQDLGSVIFVPMLAGKV